MHLHGSIPLRHGRLAEEFVQLLAEHSAVTASAKLHGLFAHAGPNALREGELMSWDAFVFLVYDQDSVSRGDAPEMKPLSHTFSTPD
jgi:hypothetical protein